MGSTSAPLKVIIVGAGFGGIGAAIECSLRGMEVTLIERYPNSEDRGDILDFFPNSGCIINSWDNGKVGARIHEIGCDKIYHMDFCKYDGKLITKIPWSLDEESRKLIYAGHRGKQHSIMLAYAETLIKPESFKIGFTVSQYKEEGGRSGVELTTGETLWGDVVLAADGPRALSRSQVLGLNDTADASGWACFRTFFKTPDSIRSHPDLQYLFTPDEDHCRFWFHEDLSMLLMTWNGGDDMAWALVHPFQGIMVQHRERQGKDPPMDDKLFTAKDARAIVDLSPPDRTIDFKLVYRATIEKWTSAGGLAMVLGDAGNTQLPTAAQGASQALEDAVTIAYCLEHCGGDARLGLEAAQRIRYHRSNSVHKSGRMNRDALHDIPWDEIEADPAKWGKKRFPKLRPWSPMEWVAEHFESVAADIRSGVEGPLRDVAVPEPEGGFWM